MNFRSIKPLVLLCFAIANYQPACADIKLKSKKFDATYWVGATTDDGDTSLSRLTLRQEAKFKIGRNWRMNVAARLEIADDDTGLGTTETFSGLSKPIIRTDEFRLEIDRAYLSYRSNGTRLTLGKHSIAWGVLDGIQITDQFSPVRRRDFVFSATRPERISRWGLKAEKSIGDWRLEGAAAFDPTVNQLPNPGDAFFPLSPRFRAGLPTQVSPTSLSVQSRNDYLQDATIGLRVSKEFNNSQLSLIGIQGPEFSPIFAPDPASPGGVLLEYPTRRLLGLTYDTSQGPFVLRFETAVIPDHPLNERPEQGLTFKSDDTIRWLTGIGVDWQAPGDVFINAQLAVDHVDSLEQNIFRPKTDTIYTVKFRRTFRNDRLVLNGEVLGSAEAGDGTISMDLNYEINEHLSASIGGNFVFGQERGTFGQFEDQSRLWLRMKLSI